MTDIKIVEYTDELASGVAKMWNNSRDSWGGDDTVKTVEQVRQEETNADNLNTYIALDGNEVVGYCSLTEYREDKGALYIPLLNVRDDYHGKKIGKALVKKAVLRTIELGWPRLDLYTWPGNTKAVPLYKKCGFFWEEKDQSTHLMNFIPTVINTEAVKDFFDEADWYQDSKRKIEIKPDGNKSGDFKYMEYSWEKNNQSLRMEFEQTGRGLRLIETDDYLISIRLDHQKLVFGTKYPIYYKIINKSGAPLQIELEGTDNENIKFDFKKEINVLKEESFNALFYVKSIDEEINDFRSQPTVTTNIKINGKKAVFNHGFTPKYPLSIKPALNQSEYFIGKESLLYIDLENHFSEKVAFSLEIPKSPFLVTTNHLDITLEANEKKTLTLNYKLHNHGFYQEEIIIKAKRKNGEIIKFNKKISMVFKGLGAQLCGETDDGWQITNGRFDVTLSKFNNLVTFSYGRNQLNVSLHYPKLGKPYTSDLSKKKPSNVDFIKEETTMIMEATYEIKDLKIINVVKLYADGMVEQFYELFNKTSKTQEDIWFYRPGRLDLNRVTLPYQNKYIDIADDAGRGYGYWDSQDITENWIFSKDSKMPIGISWNPKEEIKFGNWFFYFETHYKELNSKIKTKPIYISLGAYRDWKSFKTFALNEKDEMNENLFTTEHIEFIINDGNPVVNNEVTAQLHDYKKSYLDGNIEIRNEKECLQKQICKEDEEKNQVEFKWNHHFNDSIETIYLNANLKQMDVLKKAMILKNSTEDFEKEITDNNGTQVYSFSNQTLTIKASPDFYPALFSMVINNEEWLDSSFPKVKPKIWWNPWSGGIEFNLGSLNNRSIMKEKVNVDFASLHDQYQNNWQGLKITSIINEHEKYKGLIINQYFLMLPNIPIMCHLVEINQKTNQTMFNVSIDLNSYVKTSKENNKGFLKFNNNTYPLYQSGKDIETSSHFTLGSNERQDLLHISYYQDAYQTEVYAHKEISVITSHRKFDLASGKTLFTPPIFYVFNKEQIDEEALNHLHKLTYHHKNEVK